MKQNVNQKAKSSAGKNQESDSVKLMVDHLVNLHQLQGQLLKKIQKQIGKMSDNCYN